MREDLQIAGPWGASAAGRRAGALALAGALLGASCGTLEKIASLDFVDLPDARLANLEALHGAHGKHHYRAVMLGDAAYAFSRTGERTAGLYIGVAPRHGAKANSIPNPSAVCLELLNELLAFESEDKVRLRSIQISWCARLVAEDPSLLTRERAVIGLGDFAPGLAVGAPLVLDPAQPRAGADQVAGLLTSLVASYRKDSGSQEARAAAIAAVGEMTYDLQGARRVLYATASLFDKIGGERSAATGLDALVREMQRRTIRLALGWALGDPSGRVRGRAVAAAVGCGDPQVFAQLMGSELRMQDEVAGYLFLDLLRKRGLPRPSARLAGEEYNLARQRWLREILGLALQHPASHLRTRAMQVLKVVTEGGPASLREEDWEAWWYETGGAGKPAPKDSEGQGGGNAS
ncbi:MAG: hypothetical protein ABGY71_11575 [bacterium]|nr:hypothetical protein [Planctomycetota bacterium]HIL51766.1 hypothetical protein [Planctomycetota bacterium]